MSVAKIKMRKLSHTDSLAAEKVHRFYKKEQAAGQAAKDSWDQLSPAQKQMRREEMSKNSALESGFKGNMMMQKRDTTKAASYKAIAGYPGNAASNPEVRGALKKATMEVAKEQDSKMKTKKKPK
jgi:hypothetical protein